MGGGSTGGGGLDQLAVVGYPLSSPSFLALDALALDCPCRRLPLSRRYGSGFFDRWLVPISAAIVAPWGFALGASSSS